MGHRSRNGKARLLGLLTPLLAVAGLSFSGVASAENCAEMPSSGQIYNLVNMGSGKYMDVAGRSKAIGANILQWTDTGGLNQQFTVTKLDNGYWSIRPVHSNMAVDLYGSSDVDGGTIKQGEYSDSKAQQWWLAKSSAGGIKVASAHSRKLITVANGDNGADVFQQKDISTRYQVWHFNPVNGSCGATSGGDSSGGDSSGGDSSGGDSSANELIGLASVAGSGRSTGTTGGGNATPIQVGSCDQLANALGSDSPAVIQVPNQTLDCRTQGTVRRVCEFTCGSYYEPNNPNKTFGWVVQGDNDEELDQSCKQIEENFSFFKFDYQKLKDVILNERRIFVKSNKTLEGLGPDSRIIGANFVLNNVSNIIIRNMAIDYVNPAITEAGDAISMNNTHHIWLDHLKTSMISDGHVDMYNSENVTLSWNRFEGDNGYVCGGRHQYVNMIVNSEATFHHNYYRRSDGRNPFVKGPDSKVHIFNNLWKDITRYSIGLTNGAQVKIQGNYFENSVKPHWNYLSSGWVEADLNSNVYTGLSESDKYKDSNTVLSWRIPYSYPVDDATLARKEIATGAGPQ